MARTGGRRRRLAVVRGVLWTMRSKAWLAVFGVTRGAWIAVVGHRTMSAAGTAMGCLGMTAMSAARAVMSHMAVTTLGSAVMSEMAPVSAMSLCAAMMGEVMATLVSATMSVMGNMMSTTRAVMSRVAVTTLRSAMMSEVHTMRAMSLRAAVMGKVRMSAVGPTWSMMGKMMSATRSVMRYVTLAMLWAAVMGDVRSSTMSAMGCLSAARSVMSHLTRGAPRSSTGVRLTRWFLVVRLFCFRLTLRAGAATFFDFAADFLLLFGRHFLETLTHLFCPGGVESAWATRTARPTAEAACARTTRRTTWAIRTASSPAGGLRQLQVVLIVA
jgi:hypothetical protein